MNFKGKFIPQIQVPNPRRDIVEEFAPPCELGVHQNFLQFCIWVDLFDLICFPPFTVFSFAVN